MNSGEVIHPSLHDPDQKQLLRRLIDIHLEFYEAFLLALEAPRVMLETQFNDIRRELKQAPFLPLQAIDVRSAVSNAADLCMVALAQWVDKELLMILSYYQGGAFPPQAQSDYSKLKNGFAQYEVSLDMLPCADQMRVLRAFAQSWKQDPLNPSADIVRMLRMTMPYPHSSFGLLANPAIRNVMAERVGMTQSPGDIEVVRAYLEGARKYLQSALEAAPMVS